jgi:hypothetical protein
MSARFGLRSRCLLVFCGCISRACMCVCMYASWYFKSKLATDWLWGHLRSRFFQESEWIISPFIWLRKMGFFFSLSFTACMFGSFPVCNMLIPLVEILLHNISIIMYAGGTVCERTRLKWLPSCRFSSLLPFQNSPTFVSSGLIIVSKCLPRLKIKYFVYDHMDTQFYPSRLWWT